MTVVPLAIVGAKCVPCTTPVPGDVTVSAVMLTCGFRTFVFGAKFPCKFWNGYTPSAVMFTVLVAALIAHPVEELVSRHVVHSAEPLYPLLLIETLLLTKTREVVSLTFIPSPQLL